MKILPGRFKFTLEEFLLPQLYHQLQQSSLQEL